MSPWNENNHGNRVPRKQTSRRRRRSEETGEHMTDDQEIVGSQIDVANLLACNINPLVVGVLVESLE